MVEIVVTKADCWHAEALVKFLRPHEKFEFSLIDENAVDALEKQIEKSDAYVALIDGQPACLWGLKDHGMAGTHLWMVTSELVDKYPKKFLKESRKVVQRALKSHPMIYGYVDAKFEISCTWMEWLGFEPVGKTEFQDITLIRYEVRG